ncbi:MAG: hypothetical protein B7Z73_11145, partial [Planctomycetia bacterium 21-64-5]
DLGNLLTTSTSSLTAAGTLNTPGQVDWYKFELNYNLAQAIQGVNSGDKTWPTVLQIAYADGLGGRPNTTLSVYDSLGQLVYSGRGSNVADSQPNPTQGNDNSNLSHGSFGTGDPYIGSTQLPTGYTGGLQPTTLPPQPQTSNNYNGPDSYTYYVAISSDATLPTAMDGTFSAGSQNWQVRLEPVDGYQRIVQDNIGTTGYLSGDGTSQLGAQAQINPQNAPILPVKTVADLQQNVAPYTLNDVVMYANVGGGLVTVDPANGILESTVGPYLNAGQANDMVNIAMTTAGHLYGYMQEGSGDTDAGDVFLINTGGEQTDGLAGTVPGTLAVLPGASEGDNAFSGWGLGIADSMLFVKEDYLDPGEYAPFLAAHPIGGQYSDLLHSNESDGVDLVSTNTIPNAYDAGTMFTGAGFQPVSGGEFAKNAAPNAWLDTSPFPGGQAGQSGNPVNFGSFTITDFADRTLTFKLVELPPNVTQQDTFAGTTETIYFHYTDTSPQLTQNIAFAITDAFAKFQEINPGPAGLQEPQGIDNVQLIKGKPANPPQDFLTVDYASATNFTGTAFGAGGAGPGGYVTGMAYDLQTREVIDVSSNGGVYTSFPGSAQLTYLPGSEVFTERGWQFTGLTIGPQNLDWNGDGTPGDLANIVLASYYDPSTGTYGVTAISPYTLLGSNIFSPTTVQAGAPVSIFDAYQTDTAGNRYATGGYTDHVEFQTASGQPVPVEGIALSPVDFNLWHPTLNRGETAPAVDYNGNFTKPSSPDPGHGINDAPDYSRVSTIANNAAAGTGLNQSITWENQDGSTQTKTLPQTDGGASYYFGIDGNSLAYAPGQTT